MPDNSEYNQLVKERNSKQSQYNACSSRISNYEGRIKRLKAQKTAVTELKDLYKIHKKITKDIHEEEHQWTGSTYNKYHSKMNNVETADDYYYRNSLDFVLDSINNEITRLENLKMQEYGLLGRLGSALNSLANKIENFFN